jgi:hypothetical protein
MSLVVWIGIGLGILAVIYVFRASMGKGETGPFNLGSVSEHWVAEHRAGQTGDRHG